MSEIVETFKSSIDIPDVKPDGICYCPNVNTEEVKDGIHIVCGGTKDITKLKNKKNARKNT